MGSLLNNPTHSRPHRSKSLSKGQRLGWPHISACEPVSLRSLDSKGEKLNTYTTGQFSTNKLVP